MTQAFLYGPRNGSKERAVEIKQCIIHTHVPSNPLTESSASLGSSNSTKANPGGFLATHTFLMGPYLLNTRSISYLDADEPKFPTYTLHDKSHSRNRDILDWTRKKRLCQTWNRIARYWLRVATSQRSSVRLCRPSDPDTTPSCIFYSSCEFISQPCAARTHKCDNMPPHNSPDVLVDGLQLKWSGYWKNLGYQRTDDAELPEETRLKAWCDVASPTLVVSNTEKRPTTTTTTNLFIFTNLGEKISA